MWRESPDGITWTNASGPNPVNARDYQPPALTTDRKYKRIVRSGSLDCCIDSTGILIISIDQLPTGTITTITDTTVCSSSSVPVKIHLTGTPNWRLIYAENGVQTIINKIQSVDTTLLINRTPAGAFSFYVFKLDSLKDSNKCVALPVTLTGTRKIDVYRVPKSVAGATADTCGPAYRLKALKTYGSGKWTKISGPGVATFVPDTVVNAIVYVDSTTAAWSENNLYTFKWKEINWQCSDSASVNITFYKRTGLANAGTYPDLYSFDHIDTLHAAKPLAGTGLWTGAGGIIIDNPGDSVTVVRGLKGSIDGIPYDFLWTVTNGACEPCHY
jgi:hypothetical protein